MYRDEDDGDGVRATGVNRLVIFYSTVDLKGQAITIRRQLPCKSFCPHYLNCFISDFFESFDLCAMFKRIEKRQKKREHDEELGIDDEMKQTYGLEDTDSDESSSDSDTSSENSEADESDDKNGDDNLDRGSTADIKTEWLATGEETSEEEDESDEEELALDKENRLPRLKLADVMKNPIYIPSAEREERTCIVCPKKILKNSRMAEVHVASAVRWSSLCFFPLLVFLRSDKQLNLGAYPPIPTVLQVSGVPEVPFQRAETCRCSHVAEPKSNYKYPGGI